LFVSIVINEDGTVEDAVFVRGDESLSGLAEDAAGHWTFRPILVKGDAVKVESHSKFSLQALKLAPLVICARTATRVSVLRKTPQQPARDQRASPTFWILVYLYADASLLQEALKSICGLFAIQGCGESARPIVPPRKLTRFLVVHAKCIYESPRFDVIDPSFSGSLK